MPMWRSEELVEFILSFHLEVGSRDRTQASGLLCCNHLCPLSDLTGLHPHISESWLDHQLGVTVSLPFLGWVAILSLRKDCFVLDDTLSPAQVTDHDLYCTVTPVKPRLFKEKATFV